MNFLHFFSRRRELERLADEATRAQGLREGREFIADWRRLRALGYNVPEGGLLPRRPSPPLSPSQGKPPRGGTAVKPPSARVVEVIVQVR